MAPVGVRHSLTNQDKASTLLRLYLNGKDVQVVFLRLPSPYRTQPPKDLRIISISFSNMG